MLTYAPLPQFRDLIHALNGGLRMKQNVDDQEIAKPWCREGDTPFFFSRSAWALQAIVLSWQKRNPQIQPKILVPDYFCNQSLEPLRQISANILFYPIQENFEPDWERCESLVKKTHPHFFLMAHYFGQPVQTLEQARDLCRAHGMLFIEDAAHILHPIPGVGEAGDFVFYSPHKHLAIPDGSILLVRSSAASFISSLQEVQTDKAFEAGSVGIWVLKRAIQKTVPRFMYQVSQRNQPQPFMEDPCASPYPHHLRMSDLAQALLERASTQLEWIAMRRRANEKRVREIFSELQNWVPWPQKPRGDRSPYLGTFLCKNPQVATSRYDFLAKKGIPVGSWPDLPSEVRANPQEHASAMKLRNTLITISVHQSLKARDLMLISDAILELKRSPEPRRGG